MSYECTAEPSKIGYLMDFLISEHFPQHFRDDLTNPFDMVFGEALVYQGGVGAREDDSCGVRRAGNPDLIRQVEAPSLGRRRLSGRSAVRRRRCQLPPRRPVRWGVGRPQVSPTPSRSDTAKTSS